jgi:hypothetical protein
VAERKPFLLRLDAATIDALRSWAADDLRSLNGQIEFLLRRALREAGRLPSAGKGGTLPTAGGVAPEQPGARSAAGTRATGAAR